MQTYLVTLNGVRGELQVEADEFSVRDGALTFHVFEEPRTLAPLEADAEPTLYRPRSNLLSYASGVWRSVGAKSAQVNYLLPPTQGRVSEDPKRKQKA